MAKRKNAPTGYPSIDKTHKREERFLERHPVIPNLSIYHAFRLLTRSYLDDVAVDCEELSTTFRELQRDSVALSQAFYALGVRAGDIVTACMPNLYQAVVAFFAANRIGTTMTFLNEFSSQEEILHYLNLFHSPLLLNYDRDSAYNSALLAGSDLKHIVTLTPKEVNYPLSQLESRKDPPTSAVLRYGDLLTFSKMSNAEHIMTRFGGRQDVLILFTSGTTGTPKSVVLTNQNILAAAIYLQNSSHLSNTRGERSLVCVPFTYPYGFSTSALMSLLCGRAAILAPMLSVETIGGYLKKKPNIIFGSPALLELIMRGAAPGQDLSSVTTFISGGDFLTPSQEAAGKSFFAAHGSSITICNGFGNAETTACGANHVGIPIRSESVGCILTGSDAIIIDPDSHTELKYGEEGLLCIAGKHVFKEYYHEPELTAEVKMRYKGKTYFMTGTMGILDEDGYFTLTGREARFYITSTLNKIYCDHVQTAIASMDEVSACAVVKKPDAKRLFVGKAFVVFKPDVQPKAAVLEHIRAQCAKVLKAYEVPQDFELVESLPRTRADKIDYKTLERMAADE